MWSETYSSYHECFMHNQINLKKVGPNNRRKKTTTAYHPSIYAFFIGFFFSFSEHERKKRSLSGRVLYFYLPLHIKPEFHSIFLRILIHSKPLIGDIIQFSFLRVLQCFQTIFCIHLVNSENVNININLPSVARIIYTSTGNNLYKQNHFSCWIAEMATALSKPLSALALLPEYYGPDT